MTENLNQIQANYLKQATEKARLQNVTVNGNRATVVFSEYEAPEEMKAEFKKYDGSDGHYYYITMYIWNGVKSYYTGKEISTAHTYITSKTEGNEIYKQLKATKALTI